MAGVILKFDYIDDEIWEPEVDEKGNVKRGWLKAVSGIRRPLLSIERIKRLYVFGGKLYVLYDAPNAESYSEYAAQLPKLAVELDYKIAVERTYCGECTCRGYRFVINAMYEVERLLEKLLGVAVERGEALPKEARPANFSLAPIDITLYSRRIVGIAVVENPRFEEPGRGEATYRGRYVVLVDDYGSYLLYRVISGGEVDLEKALEAVGRNA